MLLKAKDVATRLNCSLSTVYQLIDAGRLGAFHIGSRSGGVRISEEQLAAYLDACRKESVEPKVPLTPVRSQLKHLRL